MQNKKSENICHEDTFRNLYLKYAKDVRQFLFFKTQDVEKAEDLMQDAFVKLWDNCSNVNFSKIKSYLFTTANHMFINQYRHEKVVLNYKNQSSHSGKNIENPEFIAIEKEFLDKIKKAIASLPEKQREVFVMNRIEKKKYKEIAERLDISVKAVEKRMHQALIVIRKEIGNI
jgi:RNA polymerase sigma-70 factor (ECF subfamily)